MFNDLRRPFKRGGYKRTLINGTWVTCILEPTATNAPVMAAKLPAWVSAAAGPLRKTLGPHGARTPMRSSPQTQACPPSPQTQALPPTPSRAPGRTSPRRNAPLPRSRGAASRTHSHGATACQAARPSASHHGPHPSTRPRTRRISERPSERMSRSHQSACETASSDRCRASSCRRLLRFQGAGRHLRHADAHTQW